MASLGRRLGAGMLGLVAGAAAWAGCKSEQVTELVPGFSTQVQVPRDLKTLVVDVRANGVQTFCQAYNVVEGRARLPRTLGLLPNNDKNSPVTVSVFGFAEGMTDSNVPGAVNDCVGIYARVARSNNLRDGARVLRRSKQGYKSDEVRFVPMPLRYSCWDVNCEDENTTCKGGVCKPAEVNVDTLPKYRDDFIYGRSNTCFSPQQCLGIAFPAVVVDPDRCIYALAGSASAPAVPKLPGSIDPPSTGSGLNVRVSFDGGFVTEVLDLDADEGYTIPDPAKPQQFQLAEGLCRLTKWSDPGDDPTVVNHRITSIVASGACPSKIVTQPICDAELAAIQAGDAGLTPSSGTNCTPRALRSTKSLLYIAVDRSQSMKDFFGEKGKGTVLNVSLQDPSFRYTDMGLKLLPATGAACGNPTPFRQLDVAFTNAQQAQQGIATSIANTNNVAPTDEPLLLDLLLGTDGAYRALRERAPDKNAVNRRAVLLIGNRDFSDGCGGATAASFAKQAYDNDGILTYALVFDKLPAPDAAQVSAAEAIARAGSGNQRGAFNFNTDRELAGINAFNAVISDLATCLYDAPTGMSATDASRVDVFFDNPLTGQRVSVPRNTSCTSTTTTSVDGWNFDGSRMRICGNSCNVLRDTLKATSALALARTPPLVPPGVQVFAAKCESAL